MGELTKFLRTVRERQDLKDQFFDSTFLNRVGVTLEKRGFEEARLLLWDSHQRGDLEKQAVILMSLLGEMEKIEAVRKNRAIGGHLIKSIARVHK